MLLPSANADEAVFKIEATVCRMEAVKILLSIIAALGLWNAMVCLGEDTKPAEEKVASVADEQTWAGLKMDGLILDLLDDKRRLWLGFNRQGNVTVLVGQKEGWITTPVFYWTVNGEWMQIFKDRAATQLWFQMRLLNRTKKMIRVENEAGEKQIFAIKKP